MSVPIITSTLEYDAIANTYKMFGVTASGSNKLVIGFVVPDSIILEKPGPIETGKKDIFITNRFPVPDVPIGTQLEIEILVSDDVTGESVSAIYTFTVVKVNYPAKITIVNEQAGKGTQENPLPSAGGFGFSMLLDDTYGQYTYQWSVSKVSGSFFPGGFTYKIYEAATPYLTVQFGKMITDGVFKVIPKLQDGVFAIEKDPILVYVAKYVEGEDGIITVKQGNRTGTLEDPFLHGPVEIEITGLNAETFGFPVWDMTTVGGHNVGPMFQGDNADEDAGTVGPATLSMDGTVGGGIQILRIEVRLVDHSGIERSRYIITKQMNLDQNVGDNGDGEDPVPEPELKNVKINCSNGELLITKSQRDEALVDEVLTTKQVYIGGVGLVTTYYTELTIQEFEDTYVKEEIPEPGPTPTERYIYLENEFVELRIDLKYGGAISGVWVSGSTSNILDTYDNGREIQADMQTGGSAANWEKAPWSDPAKRLLMPTQGGSVWQEPNYPLSYESTENSFHCTTRLMDYWGVGPNGEHVGQPTSWILDWTVTLEDKKIRAVAKYIGPSIPNNTSIACFTKGFNEMEADPRWSADLNFKDSNTIKLKTKDGRYMILTGPSGGRFSARWLLDNSGVYSRDNISPVDTIASVNGIRVWGKTQVELLVDLSGMVEGSVPVSSDFSIEAALKAILDGLQFWDRYDHHLNK